MTCQAKESSKHYGTPPVPPCDGKGTVNLGEFMICRGCAESLQTLAAVAPDAYQHALDDLDLISIPFGFLQWAEIAAALRCYVTTEAARCKASYRDGLAMLQEIDRVMRGADEPAPPDDLLTDWRERER